VSILQTARSSAQHDFDLGCQYRRARWAQALHECHGDTLAADIKLLAELRREADRRAALLAEAGL